MNVKFILKQLVFVKAHLEGGVDIVIHWCIPEGSRGCPLTPSSFIPWWYLLGWPQALMTQMWLLCKG